MSDFGEAEIRPEVLQAVIDNPGATIEETIAAVSAAMEPDGVDATPYPSRSREPPFDQKVRNSLRTAQHLIAAGIVE